MPLAASDRFPNGWRPASMNVCSARLVVMPTSKQRPLTEYFRAYPLT